MGSYLKMAKKAQREMRPPKESAGIHAANIPDEIEAADTVEALTPIGVISNEAQARALAPLAKTDPALVDTPPATKATEATKAPEPARPDASGDATKATEVVEAFSGLLFDPPGWARKQARICVEGGSTPRLLNPFANAISHALLGTPWRWREVLPLVEKHVEELARWEVGGER